MNHSHVCLHRHVSWKMNDFVTFCLYGVFRLVCQATSWSYLDELAWWRPAIFQIAFSDEFAHSFAWAAPFTTGAVSQLVCWNLSCSCILWFSHASFYVQMSYAIISVCESTSCRWQPSVVASCQALTHRWVSRQGTVNYSPFVPEFISERSPISAAYSVTSYRYWLYIKVWTLSSSCCSHHTSMITTIH